MKNYPKALIGLFILLTLHAYTYGQFNYALSVEPFSITGFPNLQSFVTATYNNKWVIIGGRKDGLHLRQPNSSFPAADNNTNIYVVDYLNNQVFTASVNGLPTKLKEQLQSTNMCFTAEQDKLYIVGGYGYAASVNNHITHKLFTVVDLPGLINAITSNTTITPYFSFIENDLFAVTGGQLGKINNVFLLVGGHRFDGRYNPNNGPSFTQEYTNQLRKFSISNNNGILSIYNTQNFTDANELHRRDYNMLPQIFTNKKFGYTAFSGVFQTNANLPFLNTVNIDTTGYTVNTGFNQLLNHYHSGKLALYDSTANVMYNIFFGGMAQYYYNISGNLIQDNEVPFVKTIGLVTRQANGSYTEQKIGDLPGLIGSGAELLLNEQIPLYKDEIVHLNNITTDTFTVGYLLGGINSTAENIFNTNTGTQSSASGMVYRIKLIKQTTVPINIHYFRGIKNNSSITVEWGLLNNDECKNITLQKSKNGISFNSVYTTVCEAPNNNTFSYIDVNDLNLQNYYRLKITDKNNKITFSNIIKVDFNNVLTEKVSVYPNPGNYKINIRFPFISNENTFLKIEDATGRMYYTKQLENNINEVALKIANYPKGIYLITITHNNKNYTEKFIKE